MKSLFFHNLRRINVQYANLRRKDQRVIFGDQIPGRTQTIPVKHSSHDISIGKQDRCRTVPRLHHRRIILVEILFLLGHGLVVFPGFRDCDHDCQRKRHAAHHQELQRIVKHCRVRPGSVDRRKNLVHLSCQMLRFHIFLTSLHFICIAANSIDLSVVHDKTVRMRSLPAWICVG